MKRLMRYLLPYKHYLLLAILSAILSVTASLYAPIIIGHAIDCIITITLFSSASLYFDCFCLFSKNDDAGDQSNDLWQYP